MTNLYEIGQWAQNEGLVGEKTTFLTGAAALLTWKPLGFGIISASGAGKSACMDVLVGDEYDTRPSLIKSDYFYFKDAGSATSMWYDIEKVNSKRCMILKELQKDKSHDSIEMIKSLSEGKTANRKVTDITLTSDSGEKGGIREQCINPMPVAFSLAIENDTKTDAELSRRCITVDTDVSKKQTEAVMKLKAERLWDVKSTQCLSEEDSKRILREVDVIANLKIGIRNPFAPVYAEVIAKIAPDQKTRSLMGHFWNVVEGVTKINYGEHKLMTVDGTEVVVLTNIQDLWQTMDIYLENFVRDIHSIPPMGDKVLQGFRDAAKDLQKNVGNKKSSPNLGAFVSDIHTSASVTINQCRASIKKHQSIAFKTKTVRDVCAQLVDAGYLEDDRSEKVVTYTLLDEFKALGKPDPTKMLNAASALVKEKFPTLHKQWLSFQKKPYQCPITGELVHIFEPEEDLLKTEDLN